MAAAAAARAAPGMRLSRWRRTWIHFLRRPTTGDTMKKFSVLRTPGVCLELYEGSSLIRCHLILLISLRVRGAKGVFSDT